MPDDFRSDLEQEVRESIALWRAKLAEAGKEVCQSNILQICSYKVIDPPQSKTLILLDHPFTAIDPNRVLKFIKTYPAGGNIVDHGENFGKMPSNLLLHPNTVPVLTIRDPRLAVPSAFRVLGAMGLSHGSGRPNFLISTTPQWNRMLYDFFAVNGVQALVVDADDVMTSQDFIKQLCVKLGLDPDQAQFTWPAISQGERTQLDHGFYASQRYLLESSGVDSGRAAKNLDLEAEQSRWEAEFGEDVKLVTEMVDLAMPHYRYLYERRFKSDSDT